MKLLVFVTKLQYYKYIMYSTWIDNDHQNNDQTNRRIESASKKGQHNRIQVVSKMNSALEKTQTTPSLHQQLNTEMLAQTCVDNRTGKIAFRREARSELGVDRDQQNKNVLKLMQEQLQIAKIAYEEKIKEQLKQSSIQISKLKIKIQNNNQLLASKDQQIQNLKYQLARSSPSKVQQQPAQVPNFLNNKVADIQNKFIVIIEHQNKLAQKITQISIKVQAVERGLISIFGMKLFALNKKITEFIEKTGERLSKCDNSIETAFKFQKQMSSSQGKGNQAQTQNQLQSIVQKLESLRHQCSILKSKQFKYQNSNLINLHQDIVNIHSFVGELEKKFSAQQVRLKNSKCSSRKNYDFQKRFNSNSNSCFFDDYQEVYQDVDSFGQDQFFHPLQQSARKFAHKEVNIHTHFKSSEKKNTPMQHNDSFENFTGDQDEQETDNIKRLKETLQLNQCKIPVPVEFDRIGNIRKKSDQRYLVDREKKFIALNKNELNQCKEKGWLIF